MEHSKAQTALMAKDAELERKNVEIGSLQADKASLDKLLQVGAGVGDEGRHRRQQSEAAAWVPPLAAE